MAARHHRQTLVRRQMLEKYRIPLLESIRREDGKIVGMLIQRILDDTNATILTGGS